MRFQFGTSTLLLAVAVVAIACLGTEEWYRVPSQTILGFTVTLQTLLCDSLFWIPQIFLAFTIGRKTLTKWMVLVYALATATAIGYLHWVFWAYLHA
jgi:drug/metabolite transporter (DMT)-like permease